VAQRPVLRLIRGPEAAPQPETEALVAGDKRESLDFDALFRRYAPYVGAIGLRIMGRDADLDDLVQDVFIQAHRGLSALQDPNAVKAWLARVTVRCARRRLKRQWLRRILHLEDSPEYEELADAGATPEQRAQIASAYRLLETLPADERIVWVLRYVEGETLEDIAKLCACSLSTVQRRLRAAASKMKTGDRAL
jgi:RNA polymerase sigma-70 factor (ECF subfamily)